MSLEDLRKQALESAEDDPFADSSYGRVIEEEDDLLFGMNAVERMFLSVGLFLIVSILSFLVLLLSGSIEV